jgi:glycerol-3-phosphate O-acyltransferase
MANDRPVREAENRLERFNRDRDRVLAEVERRVVAERVAAAQKGGDASLEYVLNDVCYWEMQRLEKSGGPALDRWRELSRRLVHMSESEKEAELRALVRHYGKDVVGNFEPRVYKFATTVMPRALGFLFSPISSLREGMASFDQIDTRIQVDGELEAARACAERGTIVVTPTHSSNMDSPAIGLAMLRAGLPPATYGAGKNLFTNPLISYFMRNLGAYRVDRRLRFQLYKDVLKEYSTILLESGYHSLFFPGGTRNRSNQVERNLKLGLLGTAVTAFKNNIRAGSPQKRIYIVPATINYRLVLEAETLIDDFLAEAGRSRYIITDDEFSRIGRILEFMRKILVHEGSVIVRFGRPLDPFGNEVDDDGESYDRTGRRVDPSTYVRGADGEVTDDDQRDAEYTRVLGKKLGQVYPALTVFHPTSLVARVLFDRVAAAAGTRDIYRLLRAPAAALAVPVEDIAADVDALRHRIADTPSAGAVHPQFAYSPANEIVDEAVRGLGTYHTRPAVVRRGGDLVAADLKLVYYYQNRTAHLPVEVAKADGAGAIRSSTGRQGVAS